ncbi:Tex-like N-terminal domain-containing protein [[Mycoplasma] collis]|uniref:Tex-like N-terminal domain-containing protein n=1 Tax=[Mycoplasma] collis TaxID=2127 RepID=UPI00051C06D9|nr:Tex-like N-terminal domain-containing protein [[Mycoplasma] collis]
MNKEILNYLANLLKTEHLYIERVLQLLKEENTIAFIARYRKDFTNNLDENAIKLISDEYNYQLKLAKRKEFILQTLKEKEILTDDLTNLINNAKKLVELEAIYKPYATNKKTKASLAIDSGLKPLALEILSFKKDVSLSEKAKKYINKNFDNEEKVLQGSCDIIAEIVSQDQDLRTYFITNIKKWAKLTTKKKENSLDEDSKYKIYYNFSKPLVFLQDYQVMALDRANNKNIISLKFEYDKEFLISKAVNKYTKTYIWEGYELIKKAVIDGCKRLLFPSIENQIYNEILEKAHLKSVNTFSNNLSYLLLQKPLKNKTIMGWDPGFNSGCKLAIVDKNNKLLDIKVIFPLKPQNKTNEAKKIIFDLIKKYNIEIIAIGNGTGSWESIEFLEKLIIENNLNVNFLRTSEVGASIYSASKKAQEEFSDLTVEKRSAINIARRVIDPMAELIKINPQNIGIGQYQHDIKKKLLEQELDYTIKSCVNKVGVNINSASIELLNNISGFNKKIASSVIKYIQTKGMITNRNELLKIPYLTEKVYEQAAGFLRVYESDNIFDKTKIHPESYANAEKILNFLKFDKSLIGTKKTEITETIIENIQKELKINYYDIKLILESINEPFRDFREQFDDPILRNKNLKFDDLSLEQNLKAIITNVTDFGLFADVGLKNDAFMHISKINNNDFYVGQIIDVKIESIDQEKERINLKL